MIQRLDRYVSRYYASSWAVSLVFFVGLFGVYDFFQHVDDLVDELRNDAFGIGAVGLLYLYQVPVMVGQVAPFLLVTAALITVMRMQRHNEFTAMVMLGRAPARVARPVLVLSAVFVVGLVCVREFVGPAVSVRRDALMASFLQSDGRWTLDPISMRDADGRLVTAIEYEVGSRTVGRLNVSFHDADGNDVFVTGENARYDEGSHGWRLERGASTLRAMSSGAERSAEAAFVATDVDPDALMAGSRPPFDMSYPQLLDLSRRYPASRKWRLLRHHHVTSPLALVLLVMLALRFVLKPDPARRLAGLGASLMACLAYMVLDQAMRSLGNDGTLPPVLAAWMPVIVLGSLVSVLGPPEG